MGPLVPNLKLDEYFLDLFKFLSLNVCSFFKMIMMSFLGISLHALSTEWDSEWGKTDIRIFITWRIYQLNEVPLP